MAAPQTEVEATPARDRARYTLSILFLVNLLNFYDRQILAAVTEPIRREWSLGDGAIGWLGTAFTLLYALVGLPLGRLADRASRPRILALGVATWSVCTAASGAAWNYGLLFAARMGVGIGEASCAPVGNSLIGDLYPPQRRARALSVFMLGLPLGILLSSIISGFIAVRWGWRMTFYVATVPGLVLALLALRVAEPLRGAVDAAVPGSGGSADARVPQSGAAHGSTWGPFAELLRIPTLRWIVLSGALHNFVTYAVSLFLPAYLGRYHGLDLRQANVVAGLTLGGAGIVGLLLGGVVGDWSRQWRPDGRLLLASGSLLASTPCIALALGQPPGRIVPFMALTALGWTLLYLYYVTVYAAVHEVVRPQLRGTAMSLYFFWMYVLGGAFGTSILGMLSDHFANREMVRAGGTGMTELFRAAGLHEAFLVVPVLTALLALVLFAASRTVARDMRALETARS